MNDSYAKPFRQAIAVTGGIGSGKSRVARWLAGECNFSLFDADEEVRLLLDPGEQGWSHLRAWLSPDYFGDDDCLLKAKLRRAIFDDDTLRHLVEQDLHPLVLSNIQAKMAGSARPCLVEVPLLFEAQWQTYFDGVLVVYAPEAVCLDRVIARDGISEDQAMSAIRAQMPIIQKARLADYIVDNSGDWASTQQQLEETKSMLSHKYPEKKLDSHGG